MRIRLTLLTGDRGRLRSDVELRAPAGTVLAEVYTALAAEFGPAWAAPTPGRASIWSGSRALPDSALVGGPGLRSGCILGVGAPGPRPTIPASVLRVHVVSGPDAGLLAGLPRGRVRVGRSQDGEIRLSDADVSRNHLEFSVTARGVHVRDLSSTNGTCLLADDGSPPVVIDEQGSELEVGRYVGLGETILCLATVTAPAAATSLDDEGRLVINRPPRLAAYLPAREVVFEASPRITDRAALPWLAALVPAAGGAALAWFMHNPQFLAFALLSPVLMLGTSVGERLTGGRGRRKARSSARRREAAQIADTATLAREETIFRRAAHPDPAAILQAATTPDVRVWERRPTDADFLDIRVGLADQKATFTIRRGGEPQAVPVLAAVPLSANLRSGALGVSGPRPPALALVHWALAQLCTLHSPTDLGLVALLDGNDAESWNWLRWLPHLDDGARAPRSIARTEEQRQSLVTRLNALIDTRLDRNRPRGDVWAGRWLVVVIDRAARQAALSGIGRLLRDGPSVGVTAICLDDEARRLPPACTWVARLTGEVGTRVRLSANTGTNTLALADQVSRTWTDDVARALSPLRDPEGTTSADLPDTVRLLDLVAGGLDEMTVRARWAAGAGRARAVLGVAAGGPFEIDLARDGPHTLVAGTTGAGKSELLQTLVAGLALLSGPADLQFVLIDYKGGAAFAECAQLPHTSGLVTDLDSHLTGRALRSLDAELARRESLFATVGAKDLDDYRRSAARSPAGDVAQRLGRLVLVVDEFAALAEDLPDFVAGLVGIAQRGRSLGVHLVLATQRPGGVVSPEIRANTALRIALRVTDPAESGDVVGCDDAALISKDTPGRAVVRIGTRLTALQTARIAGRPPPDLAPIEVRALDEWGHHLLPPGDPSRSLGSPTDEATDLQRVVHALGAAARTATAVGRPWLDPLPDVVDARALAAGRDRFCVAFACQDLPDEQRQPADHLDLSGGGSLLLIGGPRSGRSSALRTIAARAAAQLSTEELQLQVIDCGGGSLRGLGELPHCGSMLTSDGAISIDRLLLRLDAQISHRRAALAEMGLGSIAEARTAGHSHAAVLLVLDGWDGFLAATEDIDAGRPVDTLLHLLREGSAAGLTIVIAGDRAALATRLSSAVQRRLVLRLADPEDYAVAGLPRRSVPGRMPPGRALDSSDGTEGQLAVLGGDPATAAQLAELHRISLSGTRPAIGGALVVRDLPSRIRRAEVPEIAELAGVADDPDDAGVVIGVGGDSAGPIGIRVIGVDARFLIAGPARSGRSTVLIGIAEQLAARSVRVVIAAGSRSPLIAVAETLGLAVIGPGADTDDSITPIRGGIGTAAGPPDVGVQPVVLLIDDAESFAETVAGEWMTTLIRAAPPGLSVLATGRTDDLAVAYRGIGAELRRARSGLLLRPGPGDGDLFGVRLPFGRRTVPVGRGYLIAEDLVRPRSTPPGSIEVQVALP